MFAYSKKKNFLIPAGLILIILSVVYFIFLNKNKDDTDISSGVFADVNSSYADTTLKYSAKEIKAGQMIICNYGALNNQNKDSLISLLYEVMPGGLIYQTDSLKQYVKTQNLIQKYSEINPFVFFTKDFQMPKFEDIENFIPLNYFENSENDSLKIEYLKNLNLFSEISRISILSGIIQNNCNFSDKLLRLKYSGKQLTFADAKKFISTDSIEIKFNKKLISYGLKGVFCDETVSSGDILRFNNSYNFDGLFIKVLSFDCLNPDSVAIFVKSGVDMFITDKPKTLKDILLKLMNDEIIDDAELRIPVRKILLAKTFSGIEENKKLNFEKIKYEITDNKFKAVKNQINKESIVLLKNKNNILPFKDIRFSGYQVFVIGNENLIQFKKVILSYCSAKFKFINISDKNALSEIQKYIKIRNLIIALNDIKLNDTLTNAILHNKNSNSLTFINFGNQTNVHYIDSVDAFLQLNNNTIQEQKYAADALFGGINITGKCSCKTRDFALCDSVSKTKKTRVSDCLPEEVGLNSEILSKIDSVAKDGIRRGAYPGCQIVILKNGYNIYDKAFGYHTYAKRQKVSKTDLYDLASVTKIAATTTAAMKLYDRGRIRLNDKLGRFFKDTKIDYSNIKPDTIIHIDTLKYSEVKDFNKILKYQDTLGLNDSLLIAFDTLLVSVSPKNNIFKVSIRDLLMHKSGISPTLPILPYVIFKKNFYDSLEINKQRFYEKIKNDSTFKNKNIVFNPRSEIQKIYDKYFTKKYIRDSAEIKIADGFYFKNNWFDTLWRDTKRLRVFSRKIYQYSDINMILLQSAIDSLNKRSMNSYMRNTFYLPMGLRTMCYKPRKYFPLNRIVPTENDQYWREQLLRGNVHDPSAAMLGGISGNAGLFSDAYDLAVLGQMWLNGGTYGGIRYLSEATVKKFTGYQDDSHRGLGFDKPHNKAIIGKGASAQSFGHTGFTGTCIWVDPVNEIVFVFLSNRVNPSVKNWKINRLKIRQKIHQIVYDSMKKEI